MSSTDELEELVAAVRSGGRYQAVDPSLVRRIGAQELAKGRSWKEAIKATRNKLHQVGGAYFEGEIDYRHWQAELKKIAPHKDSPALRSFCQQMMGCHASTRERLPVMESFYRQTLAPLGQISSVLDLACGLNPLAIPWMPLMNGAEYYACDIYQDMVDFLSAFFMHIGQKGKAELCDLVQAQPTRHVQLALLLKVLPCLEQVDKLAGANILNIVRADYMLVSFPAHSLGGRAKGMVQNYEAHFNELVAGKGWSIERFEFPGELAFLVRK